MGKPIGRNGRERMSQFQTEQDRPNENGMLNAVVAKKRDPIFFLGYSSLLGQCLRLVSYATGALPHLRLRAFHRGSSLPSLCYRIAGNSVEAL